MRLQIDPEFRKLIPPLTKEEYDQLEINLCAEGCRDPLVTWNELLLDGHNRKEICERHDIPFRSVVVELPSRDAARAWIITNQFGRRNLQPYQRAELALKLEPFIAKRAKDNQRASGGTVPQKSAEPVDTRAELAKVSGLSHDTIAKAKVISEKAPEEIKQRLRTGETTINREYRQVLREEQRQKIVRDIKAAAPLGKKHVLVIDPPWPMDKIERDVRPNQHGLDYPSLSISEIQDFVFEDGRTIPELAADHAHLFLWTTQRFLPAALGIIQAWGFRYVCAFVWHKPGGPQPVGLPQYNCEFAVYARRGTPTFIDTKQFNTCFEAPRREHSRKPGEFYQVIRRVTQEPRVDIFSRETHEGFEQFGNEVDKFDSRISREAPSLFQGLGQ